jgi:hypothetical protein
VRPLADGLQAFEHLDGVGAVLLGRARAVVRRGNGEGVVLGGLQGDLTFPELFRVFRKGEL